METNGFKYKGFVGSIELDVTKDHYSGHVYGIDEQVEYQGGDVDELYKAFINSIDVYIKNNPSVFASRLSGIACPICGSQTFIIEGIKNKCSDSTCNFSSELNGDC